jgi:hypothetical protein
LKTIGVKNPEYGLSNTENSVLGNTIEKHNINNKEDE